MKVGLRPTKRTSFREVGKNEGDDAFSRFRVGKPLAGFRHKIQFLTITRQRLDFLSEFFTVER